MAAPTYFHSASAPADNGAQGDNSTVAVTPPALMTAGDLCIVVCCMRLAAPTTPAVSETGGQSWSAASAIAGTLTYFAVFWCRFNGSWTADPSWSFANEAGAIPCSVIMHVYRPATNSVWTVDTAIAGGVEASADPVVITGITPGHADNVTLAGWMVPNASTWGTLTGTGWVAVETAQYRNTTGSDLSAAFAHRLEGAAAATNDTSLKPSTAAAGGSFTMCWYATAIVALTYSDLGESGTRTDDISGLYKYHAAQSESGTAIDLPVGQFNYCAAFTTSGTSADYAIGQSPLLASGTDAETLADDLIGISSYLADFSTDWGINLSDLVASILNETLGTKGSLGDDVAALSRSMGLLSDAASFNDGTFSAVLINRAELSDSSFLADNLAALAKSLADFSTASNLTDTLSALQRILATIPEVNELIDNVLPRLVQRSSLSDEISTLIDNATALQRSLAAFADALAMSDSIIGSFPYRAETSEIATLSDSIQGRFAHLAQLSDDVGILLSDLILHSLVEVGIALPLEYSFTSNIDLLESLTALHRLFHTIPDISSFIDETVGRVVHRVNVSDDPTGLTDSIAALKASLAAFAEAIASTDNLAGVFGYRAAGIESLNVTESLVGRFAYFASLSENVSATLSDLVIHLLLDALGATPLSYALSEDSTFSDSIDALTKLLALTSDQLTISDLLEAGYRFRAEAGDSPTAIDDVIGMFSYFPNLTEYPVTTDLLIRTLIDVIITRSSERILHVGTQDRNLTTDVTDRTLVLTTDDRKL